VPSRKIPGTWVLVLNYERHTEKPITVTIRPRNAPITFNFKVPESTKATKGGRKHTKANKRPDLAGEIIEKSLALGYCHLEGQV